MGKNEARDSAKIVTDVGKPAYFTDKKKPITRT